MDEATVGRARTLWEELAGGRFPELGAVRVIETTASRLCPPGWAGIVTLEGAVLATAPTATQAALLTAALPGAGLLQTTALPSTDSLLTAALAAAGSLPAADPPPGTDPLPTPDRDGAGSLPIAALAAASSPAVVDSLGPAELAYLSPGDFQSYGDERPEDPVHPAPGVEWAGADEVAALLAAADPAEASESGLEGLPRAAVIRSDGRIVAAAGYERWPARTAHLCVLTHPGHRGRSHSTRVAAVATADALAAGLLPQWRARVPASLRVADKLGYRVLGRQRSLRLD